MNPISYLLPVLLIVCSCNTEGERSVNTNRASESSSVPLQVTVISSLPDSLKPKVYYLDSMPPPVLVAMPEMKGEVRMLPVLQDAKGAPVLDKQGNPIILGEGGRSNFTSFTTENGLPGDWIGQVLIDRNGYKWFGTSFGLSRFDGRSFLNFTIDQGLSDNNISSLFEDTRGNIWIGTVSGLNRYDGKSITNFAAVAKLAKQSITDIREDQTGNIWIATYSAGVFFLESERATHPCIQNTCQHLLQDERDQIAHNDMQSRSFVSFAHASNALKEHASCIYEDRSGDLWFGSIDGAYRFDGDSIQQFTTADGLPSNIISCVLEDKSGNIWFGTMLDGLSRFDGRSFTNFNMSNGLPSNSIFAIAEDLEGNVWFGTAGTGAARFNGRTFTPFKIGRGQESKVRDILVEENGSIWFCTENSGAHRYDGNAFVNFSTDHGLKQNSFYAITEDRAGNLWLGTPAYGIAIFNGRSFKNCTAEEGITNGSIFSLAFDKNDNIWIGSYNAGISRYDGNQFTSFTSRQGLAGNIIRSILEDNSGILWIATNEGGVSRFDGQSFTNYTTDQGLPHNTVRCILKDKDQDLWFGTKNGVSLYNGKCFFNFSIEHGLANEIVWSILEDTSRNIWFGTNNGLSVLSFEEVIKLKETISRHIEEAEAEPGLGPISIRSFSRADGLPHNCVSQLLQLPDGRIIAGTLNGIALFNPSQDLSRLSNMEVYNSELGYPIKDVTNGHNSMFLDSKGLVWIGTENDRSALVRFDPNIKKRNHQPPRLIIQKVRVDDTDLNWYDLRSKGSKGTIKDHSTSLIQNFRAYGRPLSDAEYNNIITQFGNISFDSISRYDPVPQNLILPFQHNHISFEFAAIGPSNTKLVKYQYMLEGYDRDWGPITEHADAKFGNIREGNYTFKVRAREANGVWSEPLCFAFRVLPPWYRSWWAYITYLLVFIGSWIGITRFRERNLRKEKEKLERTVIMRTEEVVKEKNEAERQKQRSDELLINILPVEVAEELKAKGSTEAKQFDDVSVLFTDFTEFTRLSEKLTAEDLVEKLNNYFSAFDRIIQKYKIEKIKTIGDAYMAAGGLPVPTTSHARDVLLAALEIRDHVEKIKGEKIRNNELYFDVRIGIHSGPLVAGIVGLKKFQYDIWGDTVNVASRMESNSTAGKVNISKSTYEILKNDPEFVFESRGRIAVKGKGEVEMYFAEKRK